MCETELRAVKSETQFQSLPLTAGSVLFRRESEFGLWRDIEKRRTILGSLFGGKLGASPQTLGKPSNGLLLA